MIEEKQEKFSRPFAHMQIEFNGNSRHLYVHGHFMGTPKTDVINQALWAGHTLLVSKIDRRKQ